MSDLVGNLDDRFSNNKLIFYILFHLVENLEDRFSCNEAHLSVVIGWINNKSGIAMCLLVPVTFTSALGKCTSLLDDNLSKSFIFCFFESVMAIFIEHLLFEVRLPFEVRLLFEGKAASV